MSESHLFLGPRPRHRSAESEFDGARSFQLRPGTGEQRVVA